VLLKSVLLQNPQSTCEPFSIDFDKSATGVRLQGGRYVSNEWISFGMTLSSSGGLASSNYPRLFNTSSVGNDPDLGSLNEYCTLSGPGKGLEGGPDGAGPNCDPLGTCSLFRTMISRLQFQMTRLMVVPFSLTFHCFSDWIA
jgi:hypothetical protein